MKIAALGKGNVGGGLADLWEAAGHEVQRVGSEGADVSGADVVLLAVPEEKIAAAFASAGDLSSTPVIDATNLVRGERPGGFDSLAVYVKSLTGGPVAKAFNANFANLYGEIGAQSSKPSCVYAADTEAKDVTERLIADAGYEPVGIGDLSAARAVEDFVAVLFGAYGVGNAPVFYRIAPAGTL